MTTTTRPPSCAEKVHDDYGVGFHDCPRPATGDDGLCGVHRRARAGRLTRERDAMLRLAASEARQVHAEQLCDQLARYDVHADPFYVDTGRRADAGYDGTVRILNPEFLLGVLRANRLLDQAAEGLDR